MVVAAAALVTTGACAPAAVTHSSRGCTKTLVAGQGSLNRFAAHLRPGAVGCLRGMFHHPLRIHNGGYRLRSAPGSRATIDGLVSFTRTAHDVVLARLTLRSPHTPNVRINGTRITIRRSAITNRHTGICISIGGGFERWGMAHGTKLLRNRIHDCGRLPVTNHDHGIYVEGSIGAVIADNLIYDNADRGIQLYPNARDSVITNNVIDGNGEGVAFGSAPAGGEYSTAYASSGNLVARNIISNSRKRHNLESWWGGPVGTSNLARENCLWNGAQGNIDLTAGGFLALGNVVAKPGFVDAQAGDFRLEPGSPCAGMGPQ
jgi:parallel beta-helix repeat protein